METAVSQVQNEGMLLREASRMYNVPLETLRRRVNGSVAIDCRPGPKTVLTKDEETKLAKYLLKMCEMGFGITHGFGVLYCREKPAVTPFPKWKCRKSLVRGVYETKAHSNS